MLVSFFNIAIFIYGVSCHRLDGKIVGGTDANIKDYPYQVSFQYANRHRCGASLIKPNVVVTAAHCTEDVGGLEKYLTIRAGSSFSQKGGQIAGIHAVCDHPKFNIDTLDYDVSVLVLNRSLPLGAGIRAIGLQPAGMEIAAGTMGTTTGWGRIKEAGPVSEQLQQIQVPKISDLDCQELYKQNATITKRMMCFGFLDGKKDTCQGDSGGPLVVAGKLAGIISWGLGCAKPKQPGVYTKISDSEISSHVNKCLKSVFV